MKPSSPTLISATNFFEKFGRDVFLSMSHREISPPKITQDSTPVRPSYIEDYNRCLALIVESEMKTLLDVRKCVEAAQGDMKTHDMAYGIGPITVGTIVQKADDLMCHVRSGYPTWALKACGL